MITIRKERQLNYAADILRSHPRSQLSLVTFSQILFFNYNVIIFLNVLNLRDYGSRKGPYIFRDFFNTNRFLHAVS